MGRLAEVRGHSAHYLARSDALPSRGWEGPSLHGESDNSIPPPPRYATTSPSAKSCTPICRSTKAPRRSAIGIVYSLYLGQRTAQPNGPFPQTNLAFLLIGWRRESCRRHLMLRCCRETCWRECADLCVTVETVLEK